MGSKRPGLVQSSLMQYRGVVYEMMDDGVLTALNVKTGAELYRERLKGSFSSSPVAGNGNVYVSNTDGVTFVVKAGRDFEVVAANDLGERIMLPPCTSALAGRHLIVV